MKNRNSKLARAQKVAIYITAFFVGISGFLGSYSFFSSTLTDAEKSERISLKDKTGLARLKAYSDSASVGGICFALCAGLMFFNAIRAAAKSKKDE